MKQRIVAFLRMTGLLESADKARFVLSSMLNFSRNREFRKNHPDTVLPPPFVLYESFGKLDYHAYYENGRESAQWIVEILDRHIDLTGAKICEWGCGPSRLLRHIPDILEGRGAVFHGTDYNPASVDWCRKQIAGVTYSRNNLNPPLDFEDNRFDALYCVSVFTHLSRELQRAWFDECIRVLKPGGVFLMTVHGDASSRALRTDERALYKETGCVIRDGVTEGKRTYTSYTAPDYMRSVLFSGVEECEHIPGERRDQDVWVVRKNA